MKRNALLLCSVLLLCVAHGSFGMDKPQKDIQESGGHAKKKPITLRERTQEHAKNVYEFAHDIIYLEKFCCGKLKYIPHDLNAGHTRSVYYPEIKKLNTFFWDDKSLHWHCENLKECIDKNKALQKAVEINSKLFSCLGNLKDLYNGPRVRDPVQYDRLKLITQKLGLYSFYKENILWVDAKETFDFPSRAQMFVFSQPVMCKLYEEEKKLWDRGIKLKTEWSQRKEPKKERFNYLMGKGESDPSMNKKNSTELTIDLF